LLWLLLPVALQAPGAALAQTDSADAGARAQQLRELQRLRDDLAQSLARIDQQVRELDARIGALEGGDEQALLGGNEQTPATDPMVVAQRRATVTDAPGRSPDEEKEQPPSYDAEPTRTPQGAETSEQPDELDEQEPYDPGPGIILARGPRGEASLGLRGYVRYINGLPLDPLYTDAFGRTFQVDRRQDFQLNRLQILTRGWLFDPRLRWSFYAWTQNVSLGDEAQVVVGGNMTYKFSDLLSIQAGIFSLPSTRSTNQSFPNWVRIDHRTMADEYFRGSYSQGLLAFGKITEHVAYSAALTNNLSALGVSADELDNLLNTYSLALWWMPTTGEYGPGAGFGDYEYHEQLATLLGARFTHSREDAQGQPAENDFENAQLRLSDGTLLFSPDPFNTGGAVQRASYAMLDLDAGAKYRGWSLDAEYYFRWLTDFVLARGEIPVSSLYDHGFQLQLSTMFQRDVLQGYASGSQIFGEYGDPWDVAFGLNFFPFHRKEVRMNVQALYTDRSAVGYTAIPYSVGGTGWIWTVDVGYWF
jgi:hypothetical protein